MRHIAIVEDETCYVQQLREYIERFSKESGERFEVSYFTDGAALIEKFKAQFDMILLDIEMPLMDGMTAAEMIRQSDPEVVIIFITNMAQYAIRGYAVDALDYLLKPINYFVFSQRLSRALGRMKKKERCYITIAVKGGSMKMEANQIFYVESQGHNLLFHTCTGIVKGRGVLKEIEQILTEHGFFRCNNGYLVNLEYVDGVRDGNAIVNGEELLISRPRKAEFLEALTKYMAGGNH